jgi:hypothetical protein
MTCGRQGIVHLANFRAQFCRQREPASARAKSGEDEIRLVQNAGIADAHKGNAVRGVKCNLGVASDGGERHLRDAVEAYAFGEYRGVVARESEDACSGCLCCGLLRRPIPRQQLVDVMGRVIGDAG